MKLVFGFAIFLVSLSPAFGTVITSTTCSASALGVSDSDSGATSCGAVASPFGPNGGSLVLANATISNTQALNANTYETTFTLNVSTRGNPDLSGQAVATASGSNSEVINTLGPVRSGLLAITTYNNGNGISTTVDYNTTAASFAQTCSQFVPNSTATCNVAPGNGIGTVTIPVTLGQSFSLLQTVSANAEGGGGNPHFSDARGTLSISAFEANGTTPVALQITPEPASFLLLGCGLVLVPVLRKKMNSVR